MKLILSKHYILKKDLNFYINKNYNIFIIKTLIGISFFYLPSFYFIQDLDKKKSFIFNNRFFFKSFLAHFFYNYSNLSNLFIVRLKIKGLGYQIYRITNKLYSFHFHYINSFYLFLPLNIIIY